MGEVRSSILRGSTILTCKINVLYKLRFVRDDLRRQPSRQISVGYQ